MEYIVTHYHSVQEKLAYEEVRYYQQVRCNRATNRAMALPMIDVKGEDEPNWDVAGMEAARR